MKFMKPLVPFLFLSVSLFFGALPAKSQWVNAPATGSESRIEQENPRASEEWFYNQRRFGSHVNLSEARLNALSARDKMIRSLGKNTPQSLPPQWNIVGPVNTVSNTDPPAHDGRVNALAVDPTNAKIAYCGAAMGGVWKTVDGGATWVPLTDQSLSLAMGALAIDPLNTQIIYAGTGEFSGNVDSYFGAGMLRTVDGGKSWKQLGLISAGAFSRIIAHPKVEGRVYAAAAKSGGGVFRSDDGGNTWTKLSNGLAPGEVTDLSLSLGGSDDVLYAAIVAHGVYRSQDGGKSWTLVIGGSQPFLQMRRIHVDSDPKDWHFVAVLSISNNTSDDFEALQMSTDGGNNWNDISGSLSSSQIFTVQSSVQGWYDAYLRMDPKNHDHLMVGGISIWATTDRGANWSDVGLAYRGGIHPDQHALEFAKSDNTIVYAANDGGPCESNDGGASFAHQRDNLAVVQFYGIAVDQNVPDLTYGGAQDNGTQKGSSTADWNEVGGGDGAIVAVDQNSSSIYFVWQPTVNYPARGDNGSGLPFPGTAPGETFGWVKPLVFDSKNNTLYAGTNYFYYSRNLGSSWIRNGLPGLSKADSSNMTCIAPFGDGTTVLVGTTKGGLYYSSNNGVVWTPKNTGLPVRTVTSAFFKPSDKNSFYVTLSGFGGGHVFKTTDGGANWINISTSLPDVPCNKIVADPQNSQGLYLGTDVGVFFSPNDGGSWVPYGLGLPNVVIADLVIHETGRTLRAGTHGRSVWQVPLSADIAGVITPTNGTIWYIGDTETISWRGFGEANVTVEISLDGGLTWILVDANAAGSLTLSPLHFPASDNALVRVRNATDTVVTPLFRIEQRLAGSLVKLVNELPLYLYDIAYDPDNKILWATDFSTSDTKIYKIDPDKGTILGNVNLGNNHNSLTGIKYDPQRKHLFVHQANQSSNTSQFYEVTTTGQTVSTQASPAVYGTGIFVRQDTIWLVDRNPTSGANTIYHRSVKDGSSNGGDLVLQSRVAPFGSRCLTWDPTHSQFLHTWTDFQGDQASAALYDSYLLRLDPSDGTELGAMFLQVGANQTVNVRGLEIDPRDGYKSAWITVLDDAAGGTSAKLYKITLVDGPKGTLGVETAVHPEEYSLGQNYPNPFNPSTTIPFSLKRSALVHLEIYDALGRLVYQTHEKYQPAGSHDETLSLDQLPSGSYSYSLSVSGVTVSHKKLILMK